MDRELNLNRAETFSFINPWIRYFLFLFSCLFWDMGCVTSRAQSTRGTFLLQSLSTSTLQTAAMLFSICMVAIGVYAKVEKATEPVRDIFFIDPAIVLIVVGVVMFFITYCGCIGALRANIRLLKAFSFSLTLVFLTQLLIAILSFFYSDQTQDALGKFVKNAIVHYHDDLDLQNLMDYIQQEFRCCGWTNYTDWSWNVHFNCSQRNPSKQRCAVPFSCCAPIPKETVINTMCGFGVQTQQYLEAAESIYTEGCADRAVMWIESHLLLVGTLALGLALPQIAGIVLSQVLVSLIQN